jgi:hypothetical protein
MPADHSGHGEHRRSMHRAKPPIPGPKAQLRPWIFVLRPVAPRAAREVWQPCKKSRSGRSFMAVGGRDGGSEGGSDRPVQRPPRAQHDRRPRRVIASGAPVAMVGKGPAFSFSLRCFIVRRVVLFGSWAVACLKMMGAGVGQRRHVKRLSAAPENQMRDALITLHPSRGKDWR